MEWLKVPVLVYCLECGQETYGLSMFCGRHHYIRLSDWLTRDDGASMEEPRGDQ